MEKIGLFFGGVSNEAEVSIMSAKNVVKRFDHLKYKLVLIYWHKQDASFYRVKNINRLEVVKKNKLAIEDFSKTFDIALLMTHGRCGEDGILQAILESRKIKYCGCRVLSSAVCMDKAIFKDLLTSRKIKQTKYLVLDYTKDAKMEIQKKKSIIKKSFTLPIYIKPANSGSSVGITKVEKLQNLDLAIKLALKHDSKIVVEEGLVGAREIEVAVLGNRELKVSSPGELKLVKDFYNYDDKYKLGQTQNIVPAKISSPQKKEIQNIAQEAYRLCDCQGFARIDFFIYKNKIYLNEINTLPGFTDISMYPMLMMNTGLSYGGLINEIIKLAY